MRPTSIVLAAALVLPACSTGLQQPIPLAVTQDAATALASYQAALGIAQVALQQNPALLARVDAVAAQAAPFVAAARSGLATAAPSLGALAAELLVEAAPYIAAVANRA